MWNKRGEGEGFILLLILLALIPMCSNSGETAYDDCIKECKEIHFTTDIDNNWTRHWYSNNTEINKSIVKEFCYNECKLNNVQEIGSNFVDNQIKLSEELLDECEEHLKGR